MMEEADRSLRLQQRYLKASGSTDMGGYREWAATRLQSFWRMFKHKWRLQRLRLPMYHIAAAEIQFYWRRYREDKYIESLEPELVRVGASMIQAAWRRYSNRQIYKYFRNLIRFKDRGDPAAMLRSINPGEAGLLDDASGCHVRFRLGGVTFPPQIYYKIYVHAPLVDMNAFSPKDYFAMGVNGSGVDPAEAMHNRGGGEKRGKASEMWYRRVENNGWRPVSAAAVEAAAEASAPPAPLPTEKGQPFHFSRVKRQAALVAKRKQRRKEWLMKMYKGGLSRDVQDNAALAQFATEYPDEIERGDELDWESEADELAAWTRNLDFEQYQSDWGSLATTNRLDKMGQATLRTQMDAGTGRIMTASHGGAGTRGYSASSFGVGSFPSNLASNAPMSDLGYGDDFDAEQYLEEYEFAQQHGGVEDDDDDALDDYLPDDIDAAIEQQRLPQSM